MRRNLWGTNRSRTPSRSFCSSVSKGSIAAMVAVTGDPLSRRGALHIAEMNDSNVRSEIRISPRAAKSIIWKTQAICMAMAKTKSMRCSTGFWQGRTARHRTRTGKAYRWSAITIRTLIALHCSNSRVRSRVGNFSWIIPNCLKRIGRKHAARSVDRILL